MESKGALPANGSFVDPHEFWETLSTVSTVKRGLWVAGIRAYVGDPYIRFSTRNPVILTGKISDNIWKQTTTGPFHIISDSLFAAILPGDTIKHMQLRKPC
jgi:hypothetical protein